MMATVGDWMRDYNEKLARLERLAEWEKAASPEERARWEKEAGHVIADCQASLERLQKVMTVTPNQVAHGFEMKE